MEGSHLDGLERHQRRLVQHQGDAWPARRLGGDELGGRGAVRDNVDDRSEELDGRLVGEHAKPGRSPPGGQRDVAVVIDDDALAGDALEDLDHQAPQLKLCLRDCSDSEGGFPRRGLRVLEEGRVHDLPDLSQGVDRDLGEFVDAAATHLVDEPAVAQ